MDRLRRQRRGLCWRPPEREGRRVGPLGGGADCGPAAGIGALFPLEEWIIGGTRAAGDGGVINEGRRA